MPVPGSTCWHSQYLMNNRIKHMSLLHQRVQNKVFITIVWLKAIKYLRKHKVVVCPSNSTTIVEYRTKTYSHLNHHQSNLQQSLQSKLGKYFECMASHTTEGKIKSYNTCIWLVEFLHFILHKAIIFPYRIVAPKSNNIRHKTTRDYYTQLFN